MSPKLKNLTDWFDKVYIINCAHRPDRLARIRKHLSDTGMADVKQVTIQPAIIGDYTSIPADLGMGRGGFGCVLPSNRVQGRIHTASKAWYSGDAVDIVMRSGDRVSLTVNHPVLTKNGFVPAGRLQKGDNLLRYDAGVEHAAACDDVQDGPTPADKAFDALLRCGQPAYRKRAAGLDLYGDGEFIQGDIQIVDINRPLLHAVYPAYYQRTEKYSFLGGHLDIHGPLPHQRPGSLTGGHVFSALVQGGHGIPPLLMPVPGGAEFYPVTTEYTNHSRAAGVPGRRKMTGVVTGSLGDGRYGLPCHVPRHNRDLFLARERLGIRQPGGLSHSPQGHRLIAQNSGCGFEADPLGASDLLERRAGGVGFHHPSDSIDSELGVRLRYLRFGHAADLNASLLQPAFDNVDAEVELAMQLLDRCSGVVVLDDIIELRCFHYEGDVFDFGTSVGYFTASASSVNSEAGIIVSNCWRSHVRTAEDWMHLRGRDGDLRHSNYLVLEDDAFFIDDALPKLNEFMNELPDDWGQLYLGGQHHQSPERVSANVVIGTSVHRTHAYAVNAPSVQQFYRHISYGPDYFFTKRHIDHQLELAHQRRDWPVYCPPAWICGQDEGHSNVSGNEDPRRIW